MAASLNVIFETLRVNLTKNLRLNVIYTIYYYTQSIDKLLVFEKLSYTDFTNSARNIYSNVDF